MKKIFLPGLLFFLTFAVHAQDNFSAVIIELTGTVEVMHSGSGRWENAERGSTLNPETIISTSFGSSALISIGNTQIFVRSLTRMSLGDLLLMDGYENIRINLMTGRVRVEVNSSSGIRHEFTIQTPSTVASVRGTIFEIDTTSIVVIEGTVQFMGSIGAPVMIDAGRISFADDITGRAVTPDSTSVSELRPDMPIASDIFDTYQSTSGIESNYNLFTRIDF